MMALINPLALLNHWREKGLIGLFSQWLDYYQRRSPASYKRFEANWLQPRLVNFPNMFSVFRMFLTLPIIWLLGKENHWAYGAAIGIFVFSCLTDFIDGPFAKAAKCETPAGAILDPLADKVLIVCLIAAENWHSHMLLPQLVVGLIAGEIAFSLMRGWRLVKKIEPYGSNLVGKTKLYGQIAVLSILLLKLPWAFAANIILLGSLVLLYWNIAAGIRQILGWHLAAGKKLPASS